MNTRHGETKVVMTIHLLHDSVDLLRRIRSERLEAGRVSSMSEIIEESLQFRFRGPEAQLEARIARLEAIAAECGGQARVAGVGR